jgi:hypothetical protein
MCDVCISIMGAGAEKHPREQCCLLQGITCPRCGPRTHVSSRCPYVSDTTKSRLLLPIPSVKPTPRSKKPYFITNTNEAFVEYCKVHSLPIEKSIDKNRAMVEAHLNRVSCVATFPPEPLEKSIDADKTECGVCHGGNHDCMKQKKATKQVARK